MGKCATLHDSVLCLKYRKKLIVTENFYPLFCFSAIIKVAGAFEWNYNDGVFPNIISLLFLWSRGSKLKMHNCVISYLLCAKYEAPKISFDAWSALY